MEVFCFYDEKKSELKTLIRRVYLAHFNDNLLEKELHYIEITEINGSTKFHSLKAIKKTITTILVNKTKTKRI